MYSNFLPLNSTHTQYVYATLAKQKQVRGISSTDRRTDKRTDGWTNGQKNRMETVTHIFRWKSHFNNCKTTNLLQLEMVGKWSQLHTVRVAVTVVSVCVCAKMQIAENRKCKSRLVYICMYVCIVFATGRSCKFERTTAICMPK